MFLPETESKSARIRCVTTRGLFKTQRKIIFKKRNNVGSTCLYFRSFIYSTTLRRSISIWQRFPYALNTYSFFRYGFSYSNWESKVLHLKKIVVLLFLSSVFWLLFILALFIKFRSLFFLFLSAVFPREIIWLVRLLICVLSSFQFTLNHTYTSKCNTANTKGKT